MNNKKLIFLLGIIYSTALYAVDPSKQLIALAEGGALNEERLDVLLRQGADIHAEDEQALREAAFFGDEAQIHLLIEHGAKPDDQMLAHAVHENQGYIIRILLSWAYSHKPVIFAFKFLQDLLQYAKLRNLLDSVDAITFSELYQKYLAQQEVRTKPTQIFAFPVYSVIRDSFNNPIEVKKSSGVYRLFEQSTIKELFSKSHKNTLEIRALLAELQGLQAQLAQTSQEPELQELSSRIHELSSQIYQLNGQSSLVRIKGTLYIKDPLSGGVFLFTPSEIIGRGLTPGIIANNYNQYLQQLLAWQILLEALGSSSPQSFLYDETRAKIEAFIRKSFGWDKDRKLPQKLQISVNNIVVQDPISLNEFIVDQNVALAIVVLVLYETPTQAQKFLTELERKNPALIANERLKTYNLGVLKTALENVLLEQERSMSISPLNVATEES